MSLFSEVVILILLKERRSFPSVPSAENVSTVCALISLAPIRIALKNGNLIGLRFNAPSSNVNQRMQLSAGHCVFAIMFLWFLVKATAISLLIFFLSTVPIFQRSTDSLLIEVIVSHESNPIFSHKRLGETLSIFAGLDTSVQLINHWSLRKFIVGIK